MLHRKLYQLCTDGREVNVFLRDQQRWLDNARVVDIEGDLAILRYETDEEDEVCAWEEMVRLDSIGAIAQKLASVPRRDAELPIAEDCPDAERFYPRSREAGEE